MRTRPAGLSVLLVLSVLVACGDDDAPIAAEEPSTTTTARELTTTSAPAPAELALGSAVDLGEGVVVGVHPSGPIAYVSAVDHDTTEVGCEGGDVARLWAQPVDGGERVLAARDSPRTDGTVLVGGAGGRIAIVDQCEGFLSALSTATPAADGTLTDIEEVDATSAETDAQLAPSTLRWSADGRSFLVIAHTFGDAQESQRVQRVALDGSVEELVEDQALVEGEQLIAVADLADGRLVTATPTTIKVEGEAPVAVSVTSIAVAPDGSSLAVFGSDGVHVLVPGQALRTVASDASSVGSWSPDGGALVYLCLVGDDAVVALSQLDGETVEVADRGGFTAPSFTADGTAVVFNAAVDSLQGYDEPRPTARPITAR